MRILTLAVVALVVGCGSNTSTSGGTGGGTSGTGGGTSGTGGGTSGTGGGTSGTGGGTGGHVVNATTSCPHVVLNNTLPAVYAGDTTGLPNWITSQRLEWTDAPDEGLKFVAPSTGDYYFDLAAANQSLGVSIRNFDGTLHAIAGCPTSAAPLANDGYYESRKPTDGGFGYPAHLDAGTNVLIWISTPSFAPVKTGPYTLTITRN